MSGLGACQVLVGGKRAAALTRIGRERRSAAGRPGLGSSACRPQRPRRRGRLRVAGVGPAQRVRVGRRDVLEPARRGHGDLRRCRGARRRRAVVRRHDHRGRPARRARLVGRRGPPRVKAARSGGRTLAAVVADPAPEQREGDDGPAVAEVDEPLLAEDAERARLGVDRGALGERPHHGLLRRVEAGPQVVEEGALGDLDHAVEGALDVVRGGDAPLGFQQAMDDLAADGLDQERVATSGRQDGPDGVVVVDARREGRDGAAQEGLCVVGAQRPEGPRQHRDQAVDPRRAEPGVSERVGADQQQADAPELVAGGAHEV